MLKTILLVIISFFAVIGFLECLLNILEHMTVSGDDQPESISMVVSLSGCIDNVPFLLNTLLMQAERINYKNCITEVIIVDNGLDENTYYRIFEFCKTNDNIYIENHKDM